MSTVRYHVVDEPLLRQLMKAMLVRNAKCNSTLLIYYRFAEDRT